MLLQILTTTIVVVALLALAWITVITVRIIRRDDLIRERLLVVWHIAKAQLSKNDRKFVDPTNVIAYAATLGLILTFTTYCRLLVGVDNAAAMLGFGIGCVTLVVVLFAAFPVLAMVARAVAKALRKINTRSASAWIA